MFSFRDYLCIQKLLRNLTHNETPWIVATDNGRVMNREISRDSIREYFKQNSYVVKVY